MRVGVSERKRKEKEREKIREKQNIKKKADSFFIIRLERQSTPSDAQANTMFSGAPAINVERNIVKRRSLSFFFVNVFLRLEGSNF